MKKIFFRCGAVLSLLIVSFLFLGAKGTETASIPKAYVLMEAETRTVLESENGDMPINAGQLSKLMAMLLVAEDIDCGKYTLETVLTASNSVTGTKGAVIWLQAGDKLSVEELVKSVIIGNANDALTVLAEASDGDTESFTKRMNTEAFDLGLRETAFYSPYGYYDEREHTTAREMAIICAELSKHECIRPYFQIWRDFVKNSTVELVNENTLSRTYSRHIGFKATHSEQCGYSAAEGVKADNGTVFISVVIGEKDSDSLFSSLKKLCNKGISEYKVTLTMFPDEMLVPLKVRKGKDFAVPLKLEAQGTIVVPKSSGELKTVTVLPNFITAPVIKGQRIGTAAFYNGKTLIYEEDIVASDDVDRLTFGYVFKKVLSKIAE